MEAMTGPVDAHHHLWDLRVRDQDWISGAELAPLRRSFLLDDYEKVAAAAGVTTSVVVQTGQSEPNIRREGPKHSSATSA